VGQAQRRKFLIAAGGLLAARLASGQTAGRTYRIGSVYLAASATTRPYEESFLAGLREQGIVRGKNLVYDVRNCDGDPARLPSAVDEVIALRPDLLVGIEQVARVMRSKTSTIPIVLSQSNDPVAAGLVKTLARPGSNVTGMAALTEAVAVKQLELLKDLLPQLKTVAVLLDPDVPAVTAIESHLLDAARAMRVKPTFYRARDREGLAKAFAAMEGDRPEGVVNSSGSGTLFGERQFIADSALRLRLPCTAASAALAEAGCLLAYGASLHDMFRRAASHAARILNGTKPGELPIEQASKFELVLNLKTAKVLNVNIPKSILLRAERVIE
jgi:putative ABC transport system substrate-binding protein